VRWLEQRVLSAASTLRGQQGRRIGVITGTAMSQLMPMVLKPLAEVTGASYELIPVVNSLFGPRVTTAGLLPGAAIRETVGKRRDLDLVLLPGESVNDNGLFIDGMSLELLAASVPAELRPSYDFADALQDPVAA
jgi:hypothetical protein